MLILFCHKVHCTRKHLCLEKALKHVLLIDSYDLECQLNKMIHSLHTSIAKYIQCKYMYT